MALPTLVLIAAALVTVWLYAPAVAAPLVYEDANITSAPVSLQWPPSRTVSNWSLRQTATQPALAHAENIGLHLLAGLLVAWLALIWAGPWPAVLSAALFWWLPLTSQAVLYVIGREDLLLAIAVLAALLASIYGRWWLMAAALVVAASTKEIGLIVGVPLVLWTRMVRRQSWYGLALLCGIGFGLVAMFESRYLIALVTFAPMGAPVPWSEFVARQTGLVWALVTGSVSLAIDHDALALSHPWLIGSTLASVGTLSLIAWSWLRRPVLAWALGAAVMAIAPRVLIGANEFVSDRHLYLSMAPLMVGLSAVILGKDRS